MSQVICSFNKDVLNTSREQGFPKHPKYKAKHETISSLKELHGVGEVGRKQPRRWVYKTT